MLGLTDDDLDCIVHVNGRFEYDASASEFGGNYVHKKTQDVSLIPSALLKLGGS